MKVRWKAEEGIVESLRAVKSTAEVAAIRNAGKLACDVMAEVIGLVRPGVRELDLAAEIGSDVTFFIHGPAAVCRGRGERVEPVVGV